MTRDPSSPTRDSTPTQSKKNRETRVGGPLWVQSYGVGVTPAQGHEVCGVTSLDQSLTSRVYTVCIGYPFFLSRGVLRLRSWISSLTPPPFRTGVSSPAFLLEGPNSSFRGSVSVVRVVGSSPDGNPGWVLSRFRSLLPRSSCSTSVVRDGSP